MRIPQIRMNSTRGQIGIRRTPGEMKIDSGNPISLDIQRHAPKLEMHTEHVRVLIDQTECFNEAGIKTMSAFMDDNVSYAKTQAMRGLGRMVDQGNQLADIGNGGSNPIPDQAAYNAFNLFNKETNMVTIPRSRPKFTIVGGKVHMNFKRGWIENKTIPVKPSIEYQRSKIEIYLEKRPSLEISQIDIQI